MTIKWKCITAVGIVQLSCEYEQLKDLYYYYKSKREQLHGMSFRDFLEWNAKHGR